MKEIKDNAHFISRIIDIIFYSLIIILIVGVAAMLLAKLGYFRIPQFPKSGYDAPLVIKRNPGVKSGPDTLQTSKPVAPGIPDALINPDGSGNGNVGIWGGYRGPYGAREYDPLETGTPGSIGQ
jgi:hypothetical protein